jgi:hypothetical protein
MARRYFPLFTDEAKAQFAACGKAQILAMSGRKLQELTQGATLMLNPNDEQYVLPEEVIALQTGRPLGGLSNEWMDEGQVQMGPEEGERLVRASAVAAQPALRSLELPLLVKDWGPDEPPPSLWDRSAVIQAPRRPEDSRTGVH